MKKILTLVALVALAFGIQAQDHHWPLTSDLSDVVGGLDGTNNGLEFEEDDERGPVAEFDGENAYANLPSFLYGLDEVTIAVWYRMDEVRPWSRIYSFGHGDQSEPKDVMMVIPVNGAGGDVDGFYRFTLSDPDGPWYDIDLDPETVPINVGEWHYSTVVLKADSIILYHDDYQIFAEGGFVRHFGTLDDSENALGKSFWPDQLFKGAMSDLRVYNSALSSGEVAELYATTKDGQTTAVNTVKIADPKVFVRNGAINVKLNSADQTGNVTVYRLDGSKVSTSTVESINATQLSQGIYLVNVRNSEVNYSTKVVIR